MNLISLKGVSVRYGQDRLSFPDWEVAPARHSLIVGPSGCGKSTLLSLIAGLLTPDTGTLDVAGTTFGPAHPPMNDRWRGQHIGVVPQSPHLIPTLTVENNLRLAQYLAGQPQTIERAVEILAAVGVETLVGRYPRQLSRGQQQRVAIARALVNRPRLLCADEVTANLDDLHTSQVLDCLLGTASAIGATLLLATHDARVKARFAPDCILELA